MVEMAKYFFQIDVRNRSCRFVVLWLLHHNELPLGAVNINENALKAGLQEGLRRGYRTLTERQSSMVPK
jgi:hypothetical protein